MQGIKIDRQKVHDLYAGFMKADFVKLPDDQMVAIFGCTLPPGMAISQTTVAGEFILGYFIVNEEEVTVGEDTVEVGCEEIKAKTKFIEDVKLIKLDLPDKVQLQLYITTTY